MEGNYGGVGAPTKVRNWMVVNLVVGKTIHKCSINSIHEKIVEISASKGEAQITYSTLRRVWRLITAARIDEMIRAYANGKLYDKFGLCFVRPRESSNELWVMDWTKLPMTLRLDSGEVVEPYLILIVDAGSGLPMGWLITPHYPKTRDVVLCFKRALLEKNCGRAVWGGLPSVVKFDNHAVNGDDLVDSIINLGRIVKRTIKYCPADQGVIERHFGILKSKMPYDFAQDMELAGFLCAGNEFTLSLERLEANFDVWIKKFALGALHSEYGMPRFEYWRSHLPHIREAVAPPLPVERAVLVTETRVVQGKGILWGETFFIGPSLILREGAKVTIGYPPEGPKGKIYLYDGKNQIGVLTVNDGSDPNLRNVLSDKNVDARKKVAALTKSIKKQAPPKAVSPSTKPRTKAKSPSPAKKPSESPAPRTERPTIEKSI